MTGEFTREALSTKAVRQITAAGTMAVLDQICELRGAPQCTFLSGASRALH